MGFQKATKKKCKARVALYGPSGSGKTFSALRIASGLGRSIAVIDTEYGSASKYADLFKFDTQELRNPNIDNMCRMMNDAHNYDTLVIDSLSHSWQELLQEVEKLAQAKYRGNTWSAWSEGTPKQKQLINSILSFPGHVVCTMRSKTEWTQDDKKRPVRVGLAPEQGKSIEYEFDLLMSLTTDHIAHIEKDRSGKFQDKVIDKPNEDFGRELAAWLDQGEEQQQSKPAASTKPQEPQVDLSAEDAAYLDDLKVQVAAEDTNGEMLNAMAFAARQKKEPLRTEALKVIRLRQIELCSSRDGLKSISDEVEKDGTDVKQCVSGFGKQRWNTLAA